MSKKESALKKVNAEILSCKFCIKNKKGELVVGEGNAYAKVVFVGEAPGKEEIKTGRPFIGRAGKVLRSLITLACLKEEDVYITSAVKYLPKTYITPKPNDIAHGRIHLQEQLNVIKPKVIVILGNTAAQSLLSKKYSISQTHGEFFIEAGYTYFISYHPAAPLYSPKLKDVMIKDYKKLKTILKKHV